MTQINDVNTQGDFVNRDSLAYHNDIHISNYDELPLSEQIKQLQLSMYGDDKLRYPGLIVRFEQLSAEQDRLLRWQYINTAVLIVHLILFLIGFSFFK